MPPRASGVLLKCRICLWYCLIQVVVEGGREGYSTTSVYNGMCGLVFQVEWHSSPSDDASISHDARLLRSHDATEWPAKACFELERKNGSFEQVSVSLSLSALSHVAPDDQNACCVTLVSWHRIALVHVAVNLCGTLWQHCVHASYTLHALNTSEAGVPRLKLAILRSGARRS